MPQNKLPPFFGVGYPVSRYETEAGTKLASGFVLAEIVEHTFEIDSDVPCQPRLNIAIVCVQRSGRRGLGMRFEM
jgi:hypothetical protein